MTVPYRWPLQPPASNLRAPALPLTHLGRKEALQGLEAADGKAIGDLAVFLEVCQCPCFPTWKIKELGASQPCQSPLQIACANASHTDIC